MIIKLFDLQNGVIVPTEHCYTIKVLKDIMDTHPDDYLKIYMFLFYMSCPNPDINPFFNINDQDKEELIYSSIDAEFSLEDNLIIDALDLCRMMYETPTSRAYGGIKKMLDRLAEYMGSTEITHGRDGNLTALVQAASKFDQIRISFKGALKDLEEEQKSQARGGAGLAYDQL